MDSVGKHIKEGENSGFGFFKLARTDVDDWPEWTEQPSHTLEATRCEQLLVAG